MTTTISTPATQAKTYKPRQFTEAEKRRLEIFLPNGVPSKIRIYDNGGETADRYTVTFTGNYRTRGLERGKRLMWFQYIAMNDRPYHPQGFGQHLESETQIDRPTYGHLGKKIRWDALNRDCQNLVLDQYVSLWDLMPHIIDEAIIDERAGQRNNHYEKGSIEWHCYNNGVLQA